MIHYADWIGYWAWRRPHWPAVIDTETSRAYSYGQLNAMANGLLYTLSSEFGLEPGHRIALLTENCAENIVLFAAAQKVGWTLLPLNYKLSDEELHHILQDARPQLMVAREDFRENLPEDDLRSHVRHEISLEDLRRHAHEHLQFEHRMGKPLSRPVNPDEPIMLLYSSGSTGERKGVIYSHRMMFWNAINTWMRLDITSNDRTVNWMPPFHTAGWNILVTPFLHHGATIVQQARFEPGRSLRHLEQYQASIFMAVPTMLHRMAEDPYFHEANLKPTRYLITGGEYISTPLITRWVRKGVPVRQGYGLTEVGPNVTSLSQEEAELKAGSVGSPNFYLRWCVVDQAGGLIFRPEEVGELYLAGPIVTPGYWNRPDESPLVEFNGEHWFPTGDLVRMDADRNLYMVDRKSNRIVSGGENIFPSEIERVLERHAAVSEVVVVGVPDPDWGEVAMAFIVAHPHTAVDENLLRRHCERKLARFKVPKRFRFVSSLPKTDSGKLDRAHLMSTASL